MISQGELFLLIWELKKRMPRKPACFVSIALSVKAQVGIFFLGRWYGMGVSKVLTELT